MAWLTEDPGGWGNSELVLLKPDGSLATPGIDAADLAWSGRDNQLAVITGDQVYVLDGIDGGGIRNWFAGVTSALAWVPGQDAVSFLELQGEGCRIRIVTAPWDPTAGELVPCGASAERSEPRGDLAWSPDGRVAAVSVRRDASVRLVDVQARAVLSRTLPDGRYFPTALAWTPNGSSLLVSGLCVQSCTPDRLALFLHDPVAGTFRELAGWNTVAESDSQDQATLEFLDANRIAVGPIFGSIALVSLDAPTTWRPLLGGRNWRVARQPGSR
jgi:hypothetical protein